MTLEPPPGISIRPLSQAFADLVQYFPVRRNVKRLLNLVALVVAIPLAFPCVLERRIGKDATSFFDAFAQTVALIPGKIGVFVRRAFYRLTLEYCSVDCKISFGAFFSRPTARVESGVYIGAYAIIGSAWLERDCLIGSRASVLSGGQLHDRQDGKWGPSDFSHEVQLRIGAGAWLGEGVIAMADIGPGAMVAAGSVVSSPVRAHIVVAGNPARFVRTLQASSSNTDELDGAQISSRTAQENQ